MGHTASGSDAFYPTSVTVPDDGDARNASSINVPLEGLLDRTAWLKTHVDRLDPIPPMNLLVGPALTANDAAYNPVRKCWVFAVNTAKTLDESFNAATSTTGNNPLVALSGTGVPRRIAIHPNTGATVVTTNGADVYESATGATYLLRSGVLSAPSANESWEITYNPLTGRWLVFTCGATEFGFYHSNDRATWTNETVVGSASSLGRMAVNQSTGEVVCMGLRGSTGITEWQRSSVDGIGTDFAVTGNNGTINHGYTSNVRHSLTWDVQSGLFIYAVGTTSGGTKIYTGNAGNSWNLVATLTSVCFQRVVQFNDVWVAAVYSDQIAISPDRGVTWYGADMSCSPGFANTYPTIVTSERQMLVLTSLTAVWRSLRASPGFNVLA